MSQENDSKTAAGDPGAGAEGIAEGIAIVAMAGRFPGAADVEALWENLCAGVESITFFSREELEAAGVDPVLLDDPRYVPARAVLDGVDGFDAPFFGLGARDAELMDPQLRLFLETCWETLEQAGYDTETWRGSIGVFGGMGMSGYLLHNLLTHPRLIAEAGALQIRILNDANYLVAQAAFRLNLTGPSLAVQTACSTSLVATCVACQSLLNYQCDAALAGGVLVSVPQRVGYLVQGGVTSPDGHCRAFDAAAQGAVEGSGVGVVMLKRLSDALADGDRIHAVIKGFATNNDGALKASFTAPSADGQMEAIAMAQALAGVDPATVTYVEAHGTGTPLGDPIEVAALSEVFGAANDRKGFCALGSIKTNIGHLDAAAGVAGLIKAALAAERGVIPASLNFETPNPQIDFENSPFYVNSETRAWVPPAGVPRRAGVSSFALGGANAHVIVEEPPAVEPGDPAPDWQLLVLSARTGTALEAATGRLIDHLKRHPEIDTPDGSGFADLAFTLQAGRRAFPHRRIVVCRGREDALAALEARDPRRVLTGSFEPREPREGIAFLLSGLGNLHAGMARGLDEQVPAFRAHLDEVAEALRPHLGEDVRRALFEGAEEEGAGEGLDLRALVGRSGPGGEAGRRLARTALAQPALFAVETALARLLIDWGLRPQALLGFSLGEYTAAHLAGVLSLADAARLVAGRARRIDELPGGAMLAVPLPESEARARLGAGLAVSAVAGPALTIVAGPAAAVAALEENLSTEGLTVRRLQATHAFHSAMMAPAVADLRELLRGVELRAPEIPYLSNVTGTWITAEQATDPEYWIDHLSQPVRFAEAVEELWREPGRVLIEVGPGATLAAWALQHPASAGQADPLALPALRHGHDRQDDRAFLLGTLGRLWLAGVRIDWEAVWAGQRRLRTPLPTYPFERRRYWIEPAARTSVLGSAIDAAFPGSATEPHEPVPQPALFETARGTVHARPNLRVAYEAPRDAAERRLAGWIEGLLGLEAVGVHDSFFELGGDSLLATRFLARVQDGFGVELGLARMFAAPTVAELAAALRTELEERHGPAEHDRIAPWPGRAAGPAEEDPPLSFAQRRLWVLDRLEPGNPFYNVPAASELKGPLRPAALAAAFAEIVRRHETLRATFHERGGKPFQRIAPPDRSPAAAGAAWPLPLIDLAALPEKTGLAESGRLAVELGRRPFDLARGPLLRTTLLRLAPELHHLVLVLHHIASDGWSNAVLTREMGVLYEAFAAGRPSPLPPLPPLRIQYPDFAAWQAARLSGERLAEEIEHWRARLAGLPPLELPADRPRPPFETHRGARRPFAIAKAEADALARLGQGEGATLFMVLLAAFATLLERYTGQRDFAVGTPVANRLRSDLEGLIGFFANTLVLRLDLNGVPDFREVLRRARDVAREAYDHQEIPFEKLIEELQPERDLSRPPLFQVMLVLQNTPVPAGLGRDGSVRLLGLDPGVARFDLLLDIAIDQAGLAGAIEYSTDLFDASTIERIEGHWRTLLAGILAHPERPIAELPLLTPAEERQLLIDWNRFEPARRQPLHALVEETARRRPEAPALAGPVPAAPQIPYHALNRRANRLAHRLRRLGVGPDVRVAIAVDRSPEMAVAVLGVLKAGGACVPLDPSYPRERLAFMLADSGAAAVLVRRGFTDFLPAASEPLWLAVEGLEGGGRPATLAEADPGFPCDPDQLAYVLYTSGSTGRPKGVAMSHGALSNLILWQRDVLPGARRTLQFSPLSFDVSFQEIFSTWAAGGTLVLVSEEARREPAELLAWMDSARVERLFLPFVALQQLAEAARGVARLPGQLHEIVTAGEQLQVTAAVEELCRRLEARLSNHYGPTETHVVTACELAGAPEGWPRLPPIGRPVRGNRTYVVDREGHAVPVGIPGELLLGGAALARGYLGRPDATAERFVPDPFGPLQGEGGGRLYRTGDLARFQADGALEFLGRADLQVKVRGYRVEPGEIEALLAAHPRVRAAAVAVRGEGHARRLVAYVAARAGESGVSTEVWAQELRDDLAAKLPEPMVPSAFVVLPALPLTPSGKVDRRALPDPAAAPRAAGPAAPRTPAEARLAGLFAEVLGEPVGIHDSFFERGGHSLLGTQLVSRIQAALGAEIPLRALFETPTVAGLASRVEGLVQAGETGAPPPPSIPRLPRTGADDLFALSFAQERLWFLDRLAPRSAAYNLPVALDLTGELDVPALASALAGVAARHEALRTVFAGGDEGPRQRVLPPPAGLLPVLDLRGLDSRAAEAEAARLAARHMRRPFDLAAGPLWRTALLRLAPGRYRLLLSLHHIAADGWSLGILVRELSALYGAAVERRPAGLPALPVQYVDYAAWQREHLAGEALDRLLRTAVERLAGAPRALALPTDRPHPAVQSYRGGAAFFRLDPAGTAALAARARERGATPFMALLAAFETLLHRYGGQDEVVVGTPVAGRPRPELEGLIGLFVNTVPLRGDLSGDPPFAELVDRTRETALDAFALQELPFERLVEALHPARDLSRPPVFQAMFQLQNTPAAPLAAPGLTLETKPVGSGAVKAELTLSLIETGGPFRQIEGWLEYSSDLFDAPTAERIVVSCETLLRAALEDPGRRIGDLPLLTEEEARQILVEWNDSTTTEITLPGFGGLVHERFAAWARRTPGALAAADPGGRLDYAGLDARSDRLARRLRRLGVGPEVRVGVFLDRSVDWVTALLAVLKAGGAYVPLDPSYPADRLGFLLEDADAPVLVTAAAEAHHLPPFHGTVVRLDDPALEGEDGAALESLASPANLAYVIYTSGSTGRPKGVCVTHANLLGQVEGYLRNYGVDAADRASLVASPAFDAAVLELWPHLAAGASVHVPPEEVRPVPVDLLEWFAREAITLSYVPTPMVDLLISEGLPAGLAGRLRLKAMTTGGDRLRGRPPVPFPRISNHYGPAEATVWATVDVPGPAAPGSISVGTPPPVGRPVPNARVYVLGRGMGALPPGVPGEIFVGGVGVARGYLGKPELTAERFVPDPYGEPGGRLYRTGDRGRWLEDGQLDFLGRLDHQVKIRGVRVEPGEVEAVLARHPAVAAAAVLALEDRPGEVRLAAFVVPASPADQQTGLPDGLRDWLRERLPEALVPSAWQALPALPLSPNGKVDRRALAGWAGPAAGEAAARPFREPRGAVEINLAGLWRELLEVERVGADDDFFDLGGHSLLAARLVSRLRASFKVDLPVRAVFESPTLAGLALAIRSVGRPKRPEAKPETKLERAERPPSIPRAPRDRDLPLSFPQERLWFLDRLEPGSAFYNLPIALRIRGTLDPDRLAGVLTEIGRRHEALRTVFAEAGDRPVQRILPPAPFALERRDLSGLPDPQGEAVRAIEAEARRPFDLATGPLWRGLLVRLGPEEHAAVLTMHHAVSDGWSMGVLVREVVALYQGTERLPELPVQYPDYAVWQRETLRGERLERELAFWKERLAGMPPVLELPADRPRPARETYRGDMLPVHMPAATAAGLRQLARRERASLFMTVLAALEALLARVSGQEDFAVGTPLAGRGRPELEGLIGFFVNTQVLRAELGGDPRFTTLLARTRDMALAAQAHPDLPFEKVVEALAPERSLARSPLFQVMLAFQNTPARALRLPGLVFEPIDTDTGTAKFDLSLNLKEVESELGGGLEYSADLFDRATAERLAASFVTLLGAVVESPETRLSDLPLLSPEEVRHLVETGRGPAPAFPQTTIPALIEAQVDRAPDAVAVEHGGERLSYAGLEARANRLAHWLRRQGLRPEEAVAVELPRSIDQVAAALAVWKAGGVYLPLDPEVPEARRAQILADSGARRLELLPDLSGESPERMAPAALPRHAAYLLYTSGSTGRPKGVVVEHGAAAQHLGGMIRELGLAPADRVLQFAALGFDVSVEQTVAPLAAGAALVLRPAELWPVADLSRQVTELGITYLNLPTAYWQAWVREGDPDGAATVSRLLVGGEAMLPEAARLWQGQAAARRIRLWNAYGPTETVITATLFPLRAQETLPEGAAVPVGRPLAHRSAHVLDRWGNVVPPHLSGELYLGGLQARGYLGRPDLTAERFVPDPFAALEGRSGQRLYRTGDRARRRVAGGDLDYLGRLDLQVKVRGIRVELGEIEAALAEHPGVREAVVVLREDAPGDRRLAAYVVPAPGDAAPDPAELRRFLGERLAAALVPAAFVLLPALPLTPAGKVDRRALPAPEEEAADAFEAPRTPVEEALAAVWAEVLGRERIGAHDDFFGLGGHSLLATRVVSRVREVLGVELPLREIFEAPTVAALAGRIEAARHAGLAAPPPLTRLPEGAPVPMSFAQQRLWFLDRLAPGSAMYNMPAALRLTGRLRPAALAAALGEIVRRHEGLQVCFPDGERAERRAGPPGTVLPEVDLGGLPAAAREAEAGRLAREEARRPFDLAAGPLWRAALVRLSGEEDHLALLTLHHIVSDGWSTAVLVRELGELYAAFVEGRPARLPELPVQYGDFAAWQRGWLQGEALETRLAGWRARLAGAPAATELPTDRPHPPVQSERGGAVPVRLGREAADALAALARRRGATLFMALLAGFQAWLHRHGAGEDLVVGSPIAGRQHRDLEGLIGFFVNTLALRGHLWGNPGFTTLVDRARMIALDAYVLQDVPFERLVEELQPARDLARPPLFQTLVALQNAPLAPLELSGLTFQPAPAGTGTAKFELSLGLTEGPAGLLGGLEYNADLFDSTTALRLAGHLARLLEAAAADPERPFAELPVLDASEAHQLRAEWNDTGADFGPGRPIHELAAERLAQQPAAAILVDGGETLTRGELAARADRLARHLRRLGAGPEERVGVCLERSGALLAGILGVLRSGAAYVPLDPAYPAERVAFMLEDSGARIAVTESRLAGCLAGFAGTVVCLDELAADGPADPAVLPEVLPRNLAYVLYTSGSTGRPKGIAVEHASLHRQMRGYLATFPMGADDRIAMVASPAFDASMVEVWPALLSGAPLSVIPGAARVDPAGYLRWAAAEGVTHGFIPVALLETVMADEALAALARQGAWKVIVTGGEQLRRRPPADFPRVANHYGPAEGTVWASTGTVASAGPLPPPLGRPVANVAVHALDREMRTVPAGVAGELYMAGGGISRGYAGNPAATAASFLPDPFAAEPGARMYRSGDLGRWRPDGTLEFLGRTDFQVKIRGVRIELGEIEAALVSHPAVAEAVVVAQGSGADRRLAAFAVLREETVADPAGAGLRAFLRERLPEAMVPAVVAILPALPLTPNDKVDRRALAALEIAVEGAAEGAAPQGPFEEAVAAALSELLGRARVSASDDFFALGGHSLLAARLTARLRDAFAVEVPVQAVFEAPTVAGLALRVERAVRTAREAPAIAPPIMPVPRGGTRLGEQPLPLSFGQERLWFLDQLEPGAVHYNLPMVMRIAGPLEPARLAAALAGVAERHEALRTTFPAGPAGEAAGPVQVVHPAPETFELPLVDLAALPDPEAEAARQAAAEAGRPFDLAAGPLWRAVLLRLGPGRHVAVLNLHHIVSDGWSMGILVREVGALYVGAPALPPLPVQYPDYAAWQRGWLRGEALERELAFWRGRLAGAPAALELPADRPRPAVESHRGGTLGLTLPAAWTPRLQALSRQEGGTLFMTLLAAFAALLGRWAGQDDLAVGTPIAGRNRPELEGLIGFFVNTLVLRADLSGAPAFRELLARTREVSLAAHAHPELPFEKLVEALAPERSLSRSPLFQVSFSLQNAPWEPVAMPGLSFEPVEAPTGTAKLDLALVFGETGEGVAGALEYSTDLFDASTVERFAASYRRLLGAALDAPEAPVWELPLLADDERRQLVLAGNDFSAHPEPCPAHELFERQADRAPAAPAVLFGDLVLSYGELEERANRLANRLRRLGLQPAAPVGVALARTPDLIASLLAVWKAGGAYLPLDPALPEARRAWQLGDAGADFLLGAEDLEDLAAESPARPAPAVTAAHLAYLIYTSGSTGQPKGVAVEHGPASVHFRNVAARYGLTAADRNLQFAAASFDVSLEQIGATLAAGATLVLRGDEPWGPAELTASVARHGVTVANLPTAFWRQWAGEGEAVPECLRLAVPGGEALPPAAARRWLESPATRGIPLLNAYGPTEAVMTATFLPVTLESLRPGSAAVPLGQPMPHRSAHVLDRFGAPQPTGVPGELCLGGLLARGYLGRPGLTAERFVPDPFADLTGQPGARLYRTGDLARRLPSGDLDYLGRLDHQVKVRGFRIELGEVEAALARHPQVRQSAVAARGDRLVAYAAAAEGGGEPLSPPLAAFLAETLPAHMVPGTFVVLAALPLTPSGKVDRRALPEPETVAGAESPSAPSDRPRNPVEEVLAAIWAEVLGRPAVGIHDDFFALGGHSLLATQVVARVRRAFQTEIPLRELFERPTVAALAARLGRDLESAAPAAPPLVPLSEEERRAGVPLSFAQQRLWFIDHLEPGNPAYNIPQAIRLEGPLRQALIEAVLTEIVRRHESLRTTFALRGAEPVQTVGPAEPFRLPLVDLAALPTAAREAEHRQLVAQEGFRPFDLARGPVLRLALLRLGEDSHTLAGAIHHIVSDEWSARILFGEVETLYRAFAEGRPSPLPELPVQYADYAVWQRGWLSGEALAAQLVYWKERLAGELPVLELPADRPRPAIQSSRGARLDLQLPAALSADLLALARREGATPFMALLAGFQALLGRAAGQEDFAIGTPISGRNRVEVEEVIGFFLNTLVLRADLAGEPSFRELLGRVRERSLEAYAHQDLPFERVVDEIKPRRSLSHTPLFQAMFVLLHAPEEGTGSLGLTLTPFSAGKAVSKFDLTLSLYIQGDGIAGNFEYGADLFDAPTMIRLAGTFERLLAAATADPGRPFTELPWLDAAQAQQTTREWNDRPAGEVWEGGIHQAFERQAAATPDRTALEWVLEGEAGSWTYAELDRQAGRLARRLRALGVGPDTRVGVCAERGPELAAALLGILKAGGAYLPLDPSYPPERLAFMVEDAGAAVVLAQAAVADRVGAVPAVLEVLDVLGSEGQEGLEGLERQEIPQDPDALSYVIYTSGSTGRPKGAGLPHRTLTNLIAWQVGGTPAGPGRELPGLRTLQFASPSFDVSLHETFATWTAGGTLVVVSEDVRRDPERLVRFLAEARIERLFLPYVALQQIAEAVVAAGPDAAARLSLQTVITAGERLQITPQIAALCAAAPGLRRGGSLCNQYGPSETHVVTEYVLAGDPAAWPAIPPIGRPIPGATTYVLDLHQQPAPLGVAGELALGGVCLARGYLGRPDLTAERFIPDSYSGEPGARLYRTGDRVRLRPDGEIEFLGRIDQQVKVHGYRIEPGEIEVALAAHPGIRECAVVARADASGDRRLVAYYVAGEDEAPEVAALAEHLRQRLPAYMVPSAFVRLPALPLTGSGKVHRAALPAPEAERGAEETYVEPGSALERTLAAALGELLGVERVGTQDNFFDLGVHSLMMVRAATLLSERLGQKVQVLQMFRFPTVAQLARHLSEGEEAPSKQQFEERAEARRQAAGRRRDRRGRPAAVAARGEAEEDEDEL